ncbi:hypothetical protein D6C90_06688 [Aureobasidium pullulans]|uniref:Uncharacterized protein n=1 Tax=Aureobasidium pullulans TaxID=5580 RepID=A0A4S9G262_AURPU|nr:hypothetical protein D6D12_09860 [Aureobasidium pullulans]THX55191.1 hypothetical protein D6D11_03928 [Aureobasidium pullulans]THX84607.1 hypothetical protein D6D04_02313 [Aureobasidium pullulans]THZ37510.1 hypothetical protein D6C90_06688 [Aureobasidium pullulans]
MSETVGALHRDDGSQTSPDNTSSISDDTSTERLAYTPSHSPAPPESLFPSWLNPAYFGHLRDARERKLEDLIKEPVESRSRMRALLYRAKEPADPSLLTSEWTWEDEVRELQERMSGLRNLIFKLHTEIELSRQPPDATEAPHDAAIVKDISPKQNPSANGAPSQSVKSHTGPPESDGNLTQHELKLQSQCDTQQLQLFQLAQALATEKSGTAELQNQLQEVKEENRALLQQYGRVQWERVKAERQAQHVKERFKSLTRTAESHMYHNEHELTRLRGQLSELQTSQASQSSVEDMNASTPSQEPEPHSYTAHHMAEIAYEEGRLALEEDSSMDGGADAQYDIDYEEQMENKCRSLRSKIKRLKQMLLIEKKRTEDAKSLLEMATKNGQYWQERFEQE